ncbi:MAG: hypothetical protein ABR600_13395 [Actinomycetota bacterium]
MNKRFLGALLASLAVLALVPSLSAQAAQPSSGDTRFACADVVDFGPSGRSYVGSTGSLTVQIELGAAACTNRYTYKLFAAKDTALAVAASSETPTISGNLVTFSLTNFNNADATAALSDCHAGSSDTSGCAYFWVETIAKNGQVADHAPDLDGAGNLQTVCVADPANTLTGDPRCVPGQLPMH